MNDVKTDINVDSYDQAEYAKFINGDITGFENLVIKHKDHLIYYLYNIVKDVLLAEDFAQDAFVEIIIHKERYNFKGRFKTYLYTIGRNKAVDYIRKNSRLLFVDDFKEQIDEESELESKIIKKEEKQELYKAIKELKKDYKEAIILVDFEGLSYKEAAKVLKKSVPQLKVLLHRARKSLADKLTKGRGGE